VLSLDAIYGYNRDAVNLSLAGAPNGLNGVPTGTMLPQALTATISNNTNVMALAKYTVGPLKLYAGYEWMQFAPPSDPQTSFTDIGGTFICAGCNVGTLGGTNINNTAYSASAGFTDKILQVWWAGAKYAITENLDVAGAYYHYNQNTFVSVVTAANCGIALTNKSQCAGTMDAYSAVIDWRFAPKWDTYIGFMFSQFNGGLANGYLARNNVDPTVGLRFRF
jgi:predicted porin